MVQRGVHVAFSGCRGGFAAWQTDAYPPQLSAPHFNRLRRRCSFLLCWCALPDLAGVGWRGGCEGGWGRQGPEVHAQGPEGRQSGRSIALIHIEPSFTDLARPLSFWVNHSLALRPSHLSSSSYTCPSTRKPCPLPLMHVPHPIRQPYPCSDSCLISAHTH